MNIKQLVARSKASNDKPISLIPCANIAEKLVTVTESSSVHVEPIWKNQIDAIEGPLYARYISKHPSYTSIYVRSSILEMLVNAAKLLPENVRLIVRAGHRPMEVQQDLLNSLLINYLSENPESSHEAALQFARTYVSDPSILLPPHCCGAAVDIDVEYKESGELVDFGCPVNTDSERAFLHSPLLTKEQHSNRKELLCAMLKAGFASNPNEWWHYSYGDQQWAYFYEKSHSLYGIVEPEL